VKTLWSQPSKDVIHTTYYARNTLKYPIMNKVACLRAKIGKLEGFEV
jgi:hypothetical protein